MGLTKIEGFKGEAELLGGLYAVEFDDGKLTVKGVNLDGAYSMLEALAAKTILSVRVGKEQPTEQPKPATKPLVLESIAPDVTLEESPLETAVTQAAEALPPPAEIKPIQPSPVALSMNFVIPEPPKPSAALPKVPETPAPAADPNLPQLSEQLINAPNLVSVLRVVLSEKQLTLEQRPEIYAHLKTIQARVPILARLGDKLEQRCLSTFNLMRETGEA